MSYADQLALFWHYLLLTTVAAGGVSTVIPDMQRYVVEVHPWMSAQTFGEVFALVQVAPPLLTHWMRSVPVRPSLT